LPKHRIEYAYNLLVLALRFRNFKGLYVSSKNRIKSSGGNLFKASNDSFMR